MMMEIVMSKMVMVMIEITKDDDGYSNDDNYDGDND